MPKRFHRRVMTVMHAGNVRSCTLKQQAWKKQNQKNTHNKTSSNGIKIHDLCVSNRQCYTTWGIQTTWSWSYCEFVIWYTRRSEAGWKWIIYIYQNHMFEQLMKELIKWEIMSIMHATLKAAAKRKVVKTVQAGTRFDIVKIWYGESCFNIDDKIVMGKWVS